MHSPSSYATIVVGVGDFGCFFDAGAGVVRFLGIFTLKDAVIMGGFLCLKSTIFCDISLWWDLCGVVFCLKISDNFLMDCNFEDPIDVNRYVGAGLDIASIRYSSELVAAYWLDIPGIFCVQGEIKLFHKYFQLRFYSCRLYYICIFPYLFPNTISLPHVDPSFFAPVSHIL